MSVYPARASRRKPWKSSPYPVRAGSSDWQQEDSGKGKGPKGKGNMKQAEMDHDEYHDKDRVALNLTARREYESSGKGTGPKGNGKMKQAEMDHDDYHDNDRIALTVTASEERERRAFVRKLADVPLGQASDDLVRFAKDVRDDLSLESEMSEHESWDSERSEDRWNILERNHNRRMGKGRKGKGNMHHDQDATIYKNASLGQDDPEMSEAESWDSERDEERSRLLSQNMGKGKGKLYYDQDATVYKNAVWISAGKVVGSAIDTPALSGSDTGQAKTMENAKDAMRFVLTFGERQPTMQSFEPTLRVLLDLAQIEMDASRKAEAKAYLEAVRYTLERCKLTHIHSDHIGS